MTTRDEQLVRLLQICGQLRISVKFDADGILYPWTCYLHREQEDLDDERGESSGFDPLDAFVSGIRNFYHNGHDCVGADADYHVDVMLLNVGFDLELERRVQARSREYWADGDDEAASSPKADERDTMVARDGRPIVVGQRVVDLEEVGRPAGIVTALRPEHGVVLVQIEGEASARSLLPNRIIGEREA